ncbi:MAG: protein-glutamate O-methyltransferase CheR [Halalkalicoccus sp.]
MLSHIETDLDFESSHYNDAYLERRIAARMRRVEAEGYGAYLEVLRSDADEREALLDSLSINVTGFFRNPAVWEGLREVLRTVSARPGPTRVWSAPCADGREPYSIAMLALDDPEIDSRGFEVLATDISEPALDVARQGVYGSSRTRDIEGELAPLSAIEPYLDREDGEFTVRENVRELVGFERHDLIRDGPKSGIDLALCRNLLIYIDAEYKSALVDTVLDSLSPEGYLAIGKTETVPRTCSDRLEAIDSRLRIYEVV